MERMRTDIFRYITFTGLYVTFNRCYVKTPYHYYSVNNHANDKYYVIILLTKIVSFFLSDGIKIRSTDNDDVP